MKDPTSPMLLADIELLLEQAARLSNHRHFVIVGSLAAIGAMVVPPAAMVMARDVNLCPKFDPDRGFGKSVTELAQGSDFAKEHGFFAAPVSPSVLSVPDGWEARLLQIPLRGGIVAWFLDPNDTAVAKLARSQENDLRWVRAGLEVGIVNADLVRMRLASVSGPPEDARRARLSLEECVRAVGASAPTGLSRSCSAALRLSAPSS